MKISQPAFVTRTAARDVRNKVNAAAKQAGSGAMLRAPVRGHDGLWVFPGLNHGSKLSINR